MVASAMLNTFWLHLCGASHYGELAFDIAEGLMRPRAAGSRRPVLRSSTAEGGGDEAERCGNASTCLAPEGPHENSPPFGRVGLQAERGRVPTGTKESPTFVDVLFRPSGLGFVLLNTQGGARCTRLPWAIFMRPYGR
jgi:hypothetical protein